MKIIISERQYKIVSEQKEIDYMTGPGSFYGTYGYDDEGETIWTKLDNHTKNQVIALVGGFIPVIGPVISLVYGLKDAKEYYDEGDKKTAGFIGLFSILPVLGPASKLLGIGGWSTKALGEIGKKISFGTKLLPAEVEVIKKVAQNRKLIEDGMKKLGQDASIRAGKKLAKKQIVKTAAINTSKTLGKEFGKFAVAGTAYSKGYDYVKSDDPKVKVSKEGMNWTFVKDAFGSSGSKEDNEKLNLAWDSGWRPGQIVPEKFQLQKYKNNYKQETDNLEELRKLLADIRN